MLCSYIFILQFCVVQGKSPFNHWLLKGDLPLKYAKIVVLYRFSYLELRLY